LAALAPEGAEEEENLDAETISQYVVGSDTPADPSEEHGAVNTTSEPDSETASDTPTEPRAGNDSEEKPEN
jgi:hypothetical protein